MAIPNGFIGTLRRFGARSNANKKRLEAWLDEAIIEIAEQKGGHLVSASTNGASFSQIANMTNAEWANALDRAIHMLDLGIKSTSTSYGNIY